MKLLCLFALLAVAASGCIAAHVGSAKAFFTDDGNASLNRYIKLLLENLKAEMPNGIPQLGIPPLEPLRLPDISPEIKESVIEFRLLIQNLVIKGLSSFVVREVKGDLNTLTFALDLYLPEISGEGRYDLNGKVLIFPLTGKGAVRLKVNELHFKGTASISIVDMQMLQLNNFDMQILFSQIQVYLEDIGGGGYPSIIVNTLLNMLGKALFDKFKDQLLPPLNNIVRSALNEQLAKVKLGDIIGGIA